MKTKEMQGTGMQAKRFVAADMRRALSLVRDELGEDAMILSTKRTQKGVELIATLDDLTIPTPTTPSKYSPTIEGGSQTGVSVPNAPVTTADHTIASAFLPPVGVGLASGKTQEELALEMEVARRRMMAVKEHENMTLGEWAEHDSTLQRIESSVQTNEPLSATARVLAASGKTTARTETKKSQQSLGTVKVDTFRESVGEEPVRENSVIEPAVLEEYYRRDEEEMRRLYDEISQMRTLFESQLSAMSAAQEQHWKQQLQDQKKLHEKQQRVLPFTLEVRQRFERLGLSQTCSNQVIHSLKPLEKQSLSIQALWSESLARLTRAIPTIVDDPVSRGGCYAFLGPTGVGKTTTIAKLAARYVMNHDAKDVILLTTDTYRIAAHDQLRSLGRILNVEVRIINEIDQLPKLLQSLKSYDLVLIDTPGMSYSDPLLRKHLTVLRQCRQLHISLVLSSNSQYQLMLASLQSYRMIKPKFCIVTKLDECASLGDAISVLATNTLPLAYVGTGQKVPEDLSIIKAHQLVSKAVSLTKTTNLRQRVEKPAETVI